MIDRDDSAPTNRGRRRFLQQTALLPAAAVVLPEVSSVELNDAGNTAAEHALTFFDTLALTQEHRGHTRHTWLRKWGWPVTVRLHGSFGDELVDDLANAVSELRDLTGHDIGIESDGVKRFGTIDVFVSPHDEIAGRFPSGNAVCNTRSRGSRGALYFARIDISEDYTDCLRHELMHALGFANHWKLPAADPSMPSILAMRRDPHRVWDYSQWDRLAMRVLYHPDMQPGLPRSVALQRAETLLRDALNEPA